MIFRIKTEQEFIEDYGYDWQNICNWNPKMNYLFGREIDLDLDVTKIKRIDNLRIRLCSINESNEIFHYNYTNTKWTIYNSMIKIYNKKPNYNSKKIIREL